MQITLVQNEKFLNVNNPLKKKTKNFSYLKKKKLPSNDYI